MKFSNLYNIIIIFIFCITLNAGTAYSDGMPVNGKSEAENSKDNISSTNIEIKSDIKTSSKSLNDDELLKYQYCGKDSDCMEVINGCCQCLQGDKYVSIAKNRFEDFKNQFKCENVVCPKDDEYAKCNEGVISCINHRCSYFSVLSN